MNPGLPSLYLGLTSKTLQVLWNTNHIDTFHTLSNIYFSSIGVLHVHFSLSLSLSAPLLSTLPLYSILPTHFTLTSTLHCLVRDKRDQTKTDHTHIVNSLGNRYCSNQQVVSITFQNHAFTGVPRSGDPAKAVQIKELVTKMSSTTTNQAFWAYIHWIVMEMKNAMTTGSSRQTDLPPTIANLVSITMATVEHVELLCVNQGDKMHNVPKCQLSGEKGSVFMCVCVPVCWLTLDTWEPYAVSYVMTLVLVLICFCYFSLLKYVFFK